MLLLRFAVMKQQEWVISKCPQCGREVYNHVVAHRKRFRTYCSPRCVGEAAAERVRERKLADSTGSD